MRSLAHWMEKHSRILYDRQQGDPPITTKRFSGEIRVV
jgi:hypothetical protein